VCQLGVRHLLALVLHLFSEQCRTAIFFTQHQGEERIDISLIMFVQEQNLALLQTYHDRVHKTETTI
jgi:hypothetical protein